MIVKPNSSRPANAERYLICKGFRNTPQTAEIRKYLKYVVQDLWIKKQSPGQDSDILELVPHEILQRDTKFIKYISQSNTTIAERQIVGLLKLKCFCQNPHLIETQQETYRSKCLNLWRIPDKRKSIIQVCTIEDIINTISHRAFMLTPPKEICDTSNITKVFADMDDWRFVPLASSKQSNFCNIFIGTSNSNVSKLVGNKWVKMKNIKLSKGTLLFGEIVKEKSLSIRDGIETEKFTLHVIDALKLGGLSLADLSFDERIKLICIFCEAINFEFNNSDVRIRPKVGKSLNTLTSNILEYNKETCEYITNLSILGPKSSSEYHSVNSLLFLKSNSHQTFYSTYVLRVIVYINEHEMSGNSFKLVDLIDYVKNFNKA